MITFEEFEDKQYPPWSVITIIYNLLIPADIIRLTLQIVIFSTTAIINSFTFVVKRTEAIKDPQSIKNEIE